MTESAANQAGTVHLDLTAGQVELLRTALKLLETTLTREEADELEAVQALLAQLPAAAA